MGAIFLYDPNAGMDVSGAKTVFARKGLVLSEEVPIGAWRLLLFAKMLGGGARSFRDSQGRFACAVGTLSYRGLGSMRSVERLCHDFAKGTIDPAESAGAYAAILWDGERLAMVGDRLRMKHVFVNDAGTCISTSFLAMVAACADSQPLNRLAVHEMLSTGFVVGPDTLVGGIRQLTGDQDAWIESTAGIRILTGAVPAGDSPPHGRDFHASVAAQIEVLRSYVRRTSPLVLETHAELGLSSGFDSRLVLSMYRGLPHPLPLHSHLTVGVHESELAVARRLAEVRGHALRTVPTHRIEDHDESARRRILADNLYLFDGRCIHDMGHCSETYGAEYRIRVMGESRMSLHGLGGEIYRNVYATPPDRFRWADWEAYAVLFPFAREACGSDDVFDAMRNRLRGKVSARLGTDLSHPVDMLVTRRYYGLVRMPACAGNVGDAYQQVSDVLMPFVEPEAVEEALRATRHIGPYGDYEAAMIRSLAPDYAAVPSQYGHAFDAVPARFRWKARMVAALPLPLRVERRRRHAAAGAPGAAHSQGCLRELTEALRAAFPSIDWTLVFRDENQRRVGLFLASFLTEFGGKVRI